MNKRNKKKENNCQPKLLYLAKLFFIIEGEVKSFCDKQKLKEIMSTKPALQKMLEGILNTLDKYNHGNRGKNKSH
jgi:hypothetical protein